VTDAPLRLVYQSFGQRDRMEAYQDRLESLVSAGVSPDVEIDVSRLDSTVIAGKGFSSAQAFDVPHILRSVAAAVEDGADAVAIGNGFDPGLWEARELLDVPILGYFETLSAHALRLAWRFGVLCSGRAGPARVEEMAARYGVWPRMTRPSTLEIDVPTIVRAMTDADLRAGIGARLTPALDELRSRGAEVAIVASGALDVLLSMMSYAAPIPVIHGVPVLVAELEAAGRMARRGHHRTSRAGRFASPPNEVWRAL
jgi:Asp/Glu/hydantoin racemase